MLMSVVVLLNSPSMMLATLRVSLKTCTSYDLTFTIARKVKGSREAMICKMGAYTLSERHGLIITPVQLTKIALQTRY